MTEEQDTREKLLKGAEDLFLRYGLRSVSMDDIARHLGVSKKTIYQYFADKDEVVATVAKQHMEKQRLQFETIGKEAKNSVEEMVMISFCMKENMRNMNPSLLFDMQKYHQPAWAEWVAFKVKFIRSNVVNSLKRGVEEGYFRPDIDMEVMALLRLEQIQMAFDSSVFPREKFDLPEVQAQLFEHFVQGLFTDKGRKLYQKYKQKHPNPTQSYSL